MLPMALFYFEKFLKDTDSSAPNRAEARKRLRVLKKAAGEEDGGDIAEVTGLNHVVVDEAPPGMPLDITAMVPEGVPWRVTVHYRLPGESKFTAVEMRYRYKELVGRIPKTATRGSQVQYYIEVEDGSSKVLERSGEPTSPHIVYLEEGAKPRFYADLNPVQATQNEEEKVDPIRRPVVTEELGSKWTDKRSFQLAKWGTTGGAALLLGTSIISAMVSSSAESDLTSESVDSRLGECLTGSPCKSFSQKQKDLESRGQTFETIHKVAFYTGALALVGAGALWYLDLTAPREQESAMSAAPVVGDDYVGASAAFRF